jgi:hypothetical protein
MDLFPLAVSPFEHYMLADDRPEYPMTFFLRLRFRGRFDRARFHGALAETLQGHPLLTARITGQATCRTSRLSWVGTKNAAPWIDWQPAGIPLSFPAGQQHLDLSTEAGLRLWLREDADTTELTAQLHHACCDGLGTVHFIETLLERYEYPESPLRTVTRDELHNGRHPKSDTDPARRRGRIERLRRIVSGVRRFYSNRPVPLARPESNGRGAPGHVTGPALISRHFTSAESDALRRAARRDNVSASSLLLRDLMLALDDWNREHSKDKQGRRLRIVVPINLRDGIRSRTTAFNATSLRFVDRGPAELGDPVRLLHGLHEQMQATAEIRRSPNLLKAIRLLGKFPYALSARMRTDRCLGSAVFSHVGILFAGSPLLDSDRKLSGRDFVLETVEAAPPVRPQTLASFAAMNYANGLTISLCYDAHCLTPAHDAQLLATYADRILRSVRQSPE